MSVLRVLSLGAGVQSTTLALMAAHGEVGPMPDCAIFADTGDEPAAIYEHLRWLSSPNVLPFPVHVASRGHLSERLFSGDDEARVPFHVGHGGLAKRQCTRNYKLKPIRRKVRELLGVGPRGYVRPGSVEQWIGISTDEAFRVRQSGFAFIRNRHPLIENGMNRRECKAWLAANGYPVPPKSACIYCPYQGDAQWLTRKEEQPAEFEQACIVDDRLRAPEQVKRFHGKLYVHRSCVPLREVDFRTWAAKVGQSDLFNNDCEGMCGV